MFYFGIDLGQRRDHTALALVERKDQRRAYLPPVFRGLEVCHAERVPLGTSYPAIVARIREILAHEKLSEGCALVVDATGVGAPDALAWAMSPTASPVFNLNLWGRLIIRGGLASRLYRCTRPLPIFEGLFSDDSTPGMQRLPAIKPRN